MDITIEESFTDIAPALSSFTSLSTLRFERNNDPIQRSSRKSIISAGPPHLKVIESGEKVYCPDLGRLTTLTAPHLLSLNVRVTFSDIEEILSILPLLTTLQSLGLAFYGMEKVSDTPSMVPHIVMPRLRMLSISGYIPSVEDVTSFDGLFAAFSVLYPNVTNVSLTFPISNMGASYLQSLQRLESIINTTSKLQDYSQIFLPTLQGLEISDLEYLQFIQAPNLINLRMVGMKTNEHLEQFLPCKLQSLEIHTCHERATTLTLPSTVLAELKRLSFKFHSKVHWALTSLPLLASIHLSYDISINHQGNMLCAQLIYRPEMCPSLREIDFGNYVEWDLLFIMLKQRNLGRKDVSRIEKISVPFVPFAFRQSLLDLLLGRERQDGPSNTVLSLEETRELICDPSMCVTFVSERHYFNEIKVQDA
ncbi:hypothetical protein M408DRAFT_31009 [Serendipita vermifera MAFF 305830]|uniref:F-box domain-containing protein n=1 Tax=Serendipita vermifera MAFF 305830 TaxID=933852 RepID=A0A0C3AHY4_SERVB|nr:hypothetical protein M408DRAFT_31009 [Serendipita vermifera MAFF 305830]